MIRELSNNYINALFKIRSQSSPELQALKSSWGTIKGRIDKYRARLARQIARDDPIRGMVDLLGPLDCLGDEVVHTRALAYLLDPNESHEIEGLLHFLVQRATTKGSNEAEYVAALLRQKGVTVKSHPEYRYLVRDAEDRLLARCDIWIEVRAKAGAALIIVENKIGASEGRSQLETYANKAKRWCKDNRGKALLLYLTRDERKVAKTSGRWINLSYVDLASALRQVWIKSKKSAGRQWLGFYIVSVVRGELGFDIDRIQDADTGSLKAYLGRG